MRSLPAKPICETIGIEALMVHAYRKKKVDRMGGDTRRMFRIRGPKALGACMAHRALAPRLGGLAVSSDLYTCLTAY